jgi:Family of unknown function (DUF6272)
MPWAWADHAPFPTAFLEIPPMLAIDQFRIMADSKQHGIVFSFNGFITEGLLFALGSALKKRMYRDEEDISTIRRVFSVFVEQAQNIIHFPVKTDDDIGSGIERLSSGLITVGRARGKFFVACGSVMRRDEAIPLQAHLEKIRSLDPAGMKAYFFERIRDPEEPSGIGANLGLIEIARRACEPIEYDFAGIDDTHMFYCLKVFI